MKTNEMINTLIAFGVLMISGTALVIMIVQLAVK
jgi:hypothetical protein